jgi:hypothetical protein
VILDELSIPMGFIQQGFTEWNIYFVVAAVVCYLL